MTKYSKFNIVYWLQKWMDSVPGQTFLNYAYSWGASIVILGTLFKLTHLEGANLMLFIGMGTEVFVFFLSAFDRPFDKTTDGMDLQTHYVTGNEGNHVQGLPQVENADNGEANENEEDLENSVVFDGGEGQPHVQGQQGHAAAAYSGPAVVGGGVVGGGGGIVGGGSGAVVGGGGTIIIGGGTTPQGSFVVDGSADGTQTSQSASETTQAETEMPQGGVAIPAGGIQGGVSTAWVEQQQKVSPEMAEATENYVEELKRLTEMLGKVNEQSVRLTRDSEEMENLNRTLTGICKVYEMQLKSASQQIGTIDQINEQSKKMAQQIEHLNKIYARMIEAMTVNMRGATPPQQTGLEM